MLVVPATPPSLNAMSSPPDVAIMKCSSFVSVDCRYPLVVPAAVLNDIILPLSIVSSTSVLRYFDCVELLVRYPACE